MIVKQGNIKWRICTNYIDLHKACPNDAYPLPSIDKLVDGVAEHKMLSFLDAYFGYIYTHMTKKNCIYDK